MHTAISDKSKVYDRASPVTTIAFIVSGDCESAMGVRAGEMASRLRADYEIHIVYRAPQKLISIFSIFTSLKRLRPSVSYVFDISYAAVLSAVCYKLIFRNCLIIETGDAIAELVRSTGNRSRFGLWLTRWLEKAAFGIADRIIVRGSFHKEWLSRHGIEADVIQDGIDTDIFVPEDASDLRKQYGLDGVITVGLVGSSLWSEKLQMCYGWELIETVRLLKERPVKGIMIGAGSGISHLKTLCSRYEIEDKIVFLGYVPYDQLPHYVNLIDICLSTQTNDLVGQVRTTGKLPLYLATGRYILASNVGEAAVVLEQEMLVDYKGTIDQDYPGKLKERIESLLHHPDMLKLSANNVTLAKKYFDYAILAKRMKEIIEATLKKQKTKRSIIAGPRPPG